MENELTSERKKEIDEMSYKAMLSIWRFADSDSPMIQGKTGEYFSKVMTKKRIKLGDAGHTAASKSLGWM